MRMMRPKENRDSHLKDIPGCHDFIGWLQNSELHVFYLLDLSVDKVYNILREIVRQTSDTSAPTPLRQVGKDSLPTFQGL